MERRLITGNEAVVLGALRSGVKVVAGYPGTPSTGAIDSLLRMELEECRHVEWSANEKVAFDIVSGAAWAGLPALCTMKMSGLNVASDSAVSMSHSGCNGALVIYVADDPGTSAGMCEQDSRGYARMFDLPVLEPRSVEEAYRFTKVAFRLSEETGAPVIVRSVTAIANSHAPVDIEEPTRPPEREPILEWDIAKYTKAGAVICTTQHREAIERLAEVGRKIQELGLNELELASEPGGLGVVASGVVCSYLDEAFSVAEQFGLAREKTSVLRVLATHPIPVDEVRALLNHCDTILVLEELEPYLETSLRVEAQTTGFGGTIVGKLDGLLSRIGEYNMTQIVKGLDEAIGLSIPEDYLMSTAEADSLAADRPITCCAGCPHRGTYLAIIRAIKKAGLRRDEVMVTGDIGCTILGMNPPFNIIWNEISMGASIGAAQGYAYAGLDTPVIATIGDSTFFHAGIPALVTAVQHQAPVTVVIMDNRWTAMTGMQVNPGTEEEFQAPGRQSVDLARLLPALGIEHFFIINPFELEESVDTIREAIMLPGVKVVLAREECAIQALRRGIRLADVHVSAEECIRCDSCLRITGCPALIIQEESMTVDSALCYGCGLCAAVCPQDCIVVEPRKEAVT